MRHRGSILIAAAALLGGCAHPPNSFRLVHSPGNLVLVPPGVKDGSVARASIPLAKRVGKAECLPSGAGVHVAGKSLIVTREALNAATAAQLNGWVTALEKNGCIDARASFGLTTALIDSLPLDFAKRRALRNGNLDSGGGGTDLTGVNSLRVVSPVWRPGSPEGEVIAAADPKVTQHGNSGLEVEIKANPDVTGYEIAWYDIRARDDGAGFRVVPRKAELHVEGQVENEAAPRVNRFDLGPEARWFRYFLMTRASTNKNDYDIVLLSAATPEELDERTSAFRKDATGYLRTADRKSYAAMTHEFGVNPYMRVKVQGVDLDVELGATVGQAIEQSIGRGKAATTLPHLSVLKTHNGKPVRVEWDHSTQDILLLPLEGGEEISW